MPSTKKMFTPPGIKTVTKYLLGAIFLIGFIAPYSHIFFLKSAVKGVFGFTRLDSFLFAIGFPFFSITLAILIHYSANYMPTRGIQKLYKIFSYLTAFTGFYFVVWSINPYVVTDFSPVFYYGAMALISVTLAYSIRFYEFTDLGKLKHKVRYVMNLMAVQAVKKGHIKDEDKYEDDIVYPALKKLDE